MASRVYPGARVERHPFGCWKFTGTTGLQCQAQRAMTEQGVKKSELARRLGWHMPQADRLFDLRHASRLDQIEAAARALGRTLEVRVA